MNRIWAFDQKKKAGWSDLSDLSDHLKVMVNRREMGFSISSQFRYELKLRVAFSFAPSVQPNNEPVLLDEWSNFLQETIQNVKCCFKGLRLL